MPATTFQNPVIPGFNPDPTIAVVHEGGSTTYFLSTSTFEFFPGCAIYSSTDLINWTLIGHALTRRSQIEMRTVEPGAGSWASTLRYRPKDGMFGKGRFYLANALFQRYRPITDERIFPRGFYVYTDNIWDSDAWSDPIYFDNPGFDQDLFWDDATSKVYLSTTFRLAKRDPGSKLKDFAIHISEIDISTGRTLTPSVVIRESPHGIAEGSHIFKRGKYYYLITAEGGTEARHQEWVSRSTEGPYGPWETQGKPIWFNGPEEQVQRTGHADIFEDGDGEAWSVLLGVRPIKGETQQFLEPPLGRETYLVKVEWVDDWPVFNDGKLITLETQGRKPVTQLLAQIKKGDIKWKAALNQEELELGWYQKHTPLKKSYTLTERPGHLRVYGNCYDLSWPECPAMLLRKQTSLSETFHAKIQFDPTQLGYEAGITVWWSQYSYATIGITLVELPNGRRVRTAIYRQPTGASNALKTILPLMGSSTSDASAEISDQATLQIEAQPASYTLTMISEDVKEKFTFSTSDITVFPPVGSIFTGVCFGIYSFGRGEPVLDPVDFSDIYIRHGVESI